MEVNISKQNFISPFLILLHIFIVLPVSTPLPLESDLSLQAATSNVTDFELRGIEDQDSGNRIGEENLD